MVTMTINRKPKGIYGKRQKTVSNIITPQQNKTTSTYKVIPESKTLLKSGARVRQTITKRQRKNRKRIMRLVELWPELFSCKVPKPIKVGIFDDLMEDIIAHGVTFGPKALRAALASYAQRPCYYRALVSGGGRYDLKGRLCGKVTPKERRDAENRLFRLKKRKYECNAKTKSYDN
ncbi:ProQ/FinO family protein [Escherichia coli]|nr:ProQ/FinO family protein [Escherichia coli]